MDVKVTLVPAQTGFADEDMEMLTGNSGFTVIDTVFDAAGFPVAQVALEVSTQDIALVLSGTTE